MEARSMTPDERRRALEQIAAEVAVCTLCPLHQGRTNAVPGEGHPDTEVVFVGEGPGYNEDQQGRPFVGAAGTLLNELLKQIGWKRQDVFITNVVKCRPPGNRDPEPYEISACAPYLKRQLEVLDPAVIVTLGRHSLGHFNPGARIGASHGTLRPADPETGASNAMTYAMYHPAAALRQGSLKQTMLEDMCQLPEALIESRKRRAPATQAPQELQVVESVVAEVSVDFLGSELPPDEPMSGEPMSDDPIAIDVEPELIAIAVAEAPSADVDFVDENQMSLF
jgi:uracil-DNA glycosylase